MVGSVGIASGQHTIEPGLHAEDQFAPDEITHIHRPIRQMVLNVVELGNQTTSRSPPPLLSTRILTRPEPLPAAPDFVHSGSAPPDRGRYRCSRRLPCDRLPLSARWPMRNRLQPGRRP